jgi:hypothetical protein
MNVYFHGTSPLFNLYSLSFLGPNLSGSPAETRSGMYMQMSDYRATRTKALKPEVQPGSKKKERES